MAAGSSAMSIDVALSSCRGASCDAFSLPQERGCAGNVALIFIVQDCPIKGVSNIAQLQRSSTVIILHVMQLRFEKFRVGTTDFSERGADWRIECDSA